MHTQQWTHTHHEPGADWDKISGREISHSSRPSHTPTTNSETWTTLLAYLYDHHIKRSKSLVGPWKIIKGSLLNCTFASIFLFFIFSNISVTPFFSCTCHFFTSRSTVINRTVFTLLQNNHLIAICLHIMLLFLLKWLKHPRFNKPIIHTKIEKQIF